VDESARDEKQFAAIQQTVIRYQLICHDAIRDLALEHSDALNEMQLRELVTTIGRLVRLQDGVNEIWGHFTAGEISAVSVMTHVEQLRNELGLAQLQDNEKDNDEE
jgi:hypothetical protein